MTKQNQNDSNNQNDQAGAVRPVVSIWTLGCKVNQYETQALKERFSALGYAVLSDERVSREADETDDIKGISQPDKADVYVINTCTVTSLSDKKSRQYIRKARRKNPQAIIAVTGCFAQTSPEEAAAIEGVSIVVGTQEKHNLPELVEAHRKALGENNALLQPITTPWQQMTVYEDTGAIVSMDSHTRAFIKIEDGCDRFCSYCIIPYARGPVRSRRLSDIVAEARQLIDRGFKELVLTGINAALYTPDMAEGCDFSALQDTGAPQSHHGLSGQSDSGTPQGIEAVVAALDALPGDFRIRLGSLEPTVVDEHYINKLLKYKKLCPHMHLSLQSGSDKILSAMNRAYTQKDYLAILLALKEFDPGYGVTTDIITGFPGESEGDFAESVKLVNMVDFCKVHVFPYSGRKGTKAALMPDQINPQIKSERSAKLSRLAEQGCARFFTNNIGTVRTVLVEEVLTTLLTGYTENYIKVYFEADPRLINTFCHVRLTGLYRDGMKGTPI